MTIETGNEEIGLVLDSNIIISSLIFSGKQTQLIEKIILKGKGVRVYTSVKLIAETLEVLRKKFSFSENKIKQLENEMLDKFSVVYPTKVINVVRDVDDNRVLEVAVEAQCNYIITGDKDLLVLKKYKKIKILTPSEFLSLIQ